MLFNCKINLTNVQNQQEFIFKSLARTNLIKTRSNLIYKITRNTPTNLKQELCLTATRKILSYNSLITNRYAISAEASYEPLVVTKPALSPVVAHDLSHRYAISEESYEPLVVTKPFLSPVVDSRPLTQV